MYVKVLYRKVMMPTRQGEGRDITSSVLFLSHQGTEHAALGQGLAGDRRGRGWSSHGASQNNKKAQKVTRSLAGRNNNTVIRVRGVGTNCSPFWESQQLEGAIKEERDIVQTPRPSERREE